MSFAILHRTVAAGQPLPHLAEGRVVDPWTRGAIAAARARAACNSPAAASEAWLAGARRDIAELAVAFERRPLLRPSGWDGLCA